MEKMDVTVLLSRNTSVANTVMMMTRMIIMYVHPHVINVSVPSPFVVTLQFPASLPVFQIVKHILYSYCVS
jgi:hypothetical protein